MENNFITLKTIKNALFQFILSWKSVNYIRIYVNHYILKYLLVKMLKFNMNSII